MICDDDTITVAKIAKTINVTPRTIYRDLKQMGIRWEGHTKNRSLDTIQTIVASKEEKQWFYSRQFGLFRMLTVCHGVILSSCCAIPVSVAALASQTHRTHRDCGS